MRVLLLSLFSLFLTISSVAQTATKNVLYQIQDPDGEDPTVGLIQAGDGNFYGVSAGSGAYGDGTVFQVTPAGGYKIIYNFTGGLDGDQPQGLSLGPDGMLYGTTTSAGVAAGGTIFKIAVDGTFTLLHGLDPLTEGSAPSGALTLGSDGNFYGTAKIGGTNNRGSIFKMTPAGTVTLLYAFTGLLDGNSPYASLVQASDGNFYGVATQGGANGGGTIYQVTPGGSFKVIASLSTTVANASLRALVQGADGALYGTSISGTNSTYGSIFKVTLDGTYSTVYTFTNSTDGAGPRSSLLLASDGNFYGGSTGGNGTIYRLTPTGTLSTIYAFTGSADGKYPQGALIQGTDGNLYGVAQLGGKYTDGNIFQIAFSPAESGPISLTFDKATIPLGTTAKLTWTLTGAYSVTAQQCFASVQGGSDAGWTGQQKGTLTNGVLTGTATITPSVKGNVTYVLGCGGNKLGTATISVGDANPVSITTSSLDSGVVGTSYSASLAATGGVQPYTWTATAATLPPGLTLSSTGLISGTPTAYGVYSVGIQVSDAEGTPLTATTSLSLTISAAQPTLTAAPTTLQVSAPGGSASGTLSLSGFSSSSITFACSNLPHGATCSFGTLTGSGLFGSGTFTISTSAPAKAEMHSIPLPGGSDNAPRYAFVASGIFLLLGFRGCRRKLSMKSVSLVAGLAFLALSMSGCGGNSQNASTPDQGTPVGSSAVTITATAGAQTASAVVNLSVQ